MFRFIENTGDLYIFCDDDNAYIFCGNYSGMTEEQAIDSYQCNFK